MKFLPALLAVAAVLSGCQSFAPAPLPMMLADSHQLNPSGFAPLTGIIKIQTDVPSRLALWVPGKDAHTEINHTFDEPLTEHHIPVLGLYADTANTVRVTLLSADGEAAGAHDYVFETEPLIDGMPLISISVSAPEQMADGWTLVSYTSRHPLRPFFFDDNGDIRWYLDLQEHPHLRKLKYGTGLARLANGNFFFGDRRADIIYEMDLFGTVVNQWEIPGYGFHHHVMEKPDGNFLLTSEKDKAKTILDYVVEVKRDSGEVVRAWNMKQSLQQARTAMLENVLSGRRAERDWFHGNGVEFSPADDTILVSGRTQGVSKLTADNRVVWILSPHIGWGISGQGRNLNQFLLQPLDAAGNPITDEAVLRGEKRHADFDWPWYQHAPIFLPDGNLMLFDNGDNRYLDTESERYSRVVAYKIDEDAMTVQQVWEWGRQMGNTMYSKFVSDVDYFADNKSVVMSSGGVRIFPDEKRGRKAGRIAEVDYDSGELLFYADLVVPGRSRLFLFQRTERLPIYPPNLSTTPPAAPTPAE